MAALIFEKFLEMLDRTEYPENELPLPDTLRKRYGLNLVDVSADFELEENGYRKVEVSPQELWRLDIC